MVSYLNNFRKNIPGREKIMGAFWDLLNSTVNSAQFGYNILFLLTFFQILEA